VVPAAVAPNGGGSSEAGPIRFPGNGARPTVPAADAPPPAAHPPAPADETEDFPAAEQIVERDDEIDARDTAIHWSAS
jgi:hypothetical protein